MTRLPTPGGDDGTWGEILNSFLAVSLNNDGTLNTSSLIQAGAITTINSKTPINGSISLGASDIGALTQSSADLRYTQISNLGQKDGIATLDSSGNVPVTQLSNVPPSPVTSVNSKTGVIDLTYTDVGADPAGAAAQAQANAEANSIALSQKGSSGGVATLDSMSRIVSSQSLSSIEREILKDSPFAWWRLDDPLGSTTVSDYSVNNNAATVNGGIAFGQWPTFPTLPDHYSAKFDGTTGYILTPYKWGDSVFSIEAWINGNGNNWPSSHAVIIGSDYPTSYISILNSAPYVNLNINNAAAIVQSQFPLLNTGWNHLVATYDGSSLKLYVNSSLVGATSTSGSSIGGSSVVLGALGNTTPSLFFPGLMSNVAIYKTALSEYRISSHYSSGLTASLPPIQILTSSLSGFVPSGAYHLRFNLIGGGGGGGGGGSALTSGGISNQAGGAGGGAAGWCERIINVEPGQSWEVIVGAGGAGGTGGAVNGVNGADGVGGTSTTLSINNITQGVARYGNYAGGSQGNSSAPGESLGWSYYGPSFNPEQQGIGGGGPGNIIYPEAPIPGAVLFGGGLGGTATSTNGGEAGGNPSSINWASSSPGNTGGSSTANGISASDSTEYGCGGSGGGGGAPGGSGGGGGAGGPGIAYLEWLP